MPLIPKSLRTAIQELDNAHLYEIRELVESLIQERCRPPQPEELPDGREVLKVQTLGSMTYRLERVSCGKNCKGCPHGPYWYGYWREGGRTRSKYIGKSLDSQKTKKM